MSDWLGHQAWGHDKNCIKLSVIICRDFMILSWRPIGIPLLLQYRVPSLCKALNGQDNP